MIFASIDIGSNAMRLLFANVFEDLEGKLLPARTAFIRIPIRLGGDVFSEGKISPEREKKLLKTLSAFKTLIEVNEAVAYEACATSAMREARNGEQIIARIKKETGIVVRVISGQEEAKIIREAGEMSTFSDFPMTMFIDVGGGSTEISVLEGNSLVTSESFNLGTLRLLSENFDPKEWTRLAVWLTQFEPFFGQIECVGSGGNINKITKLFGNKDRKKISLVQFEKAYSDLLKLSVERRMEVYNMRADRADVIVPAADIFLRIMRTVRADHIVAPKFGLADGLALNLYRKHKAQHSTLQYENLH